MVIRKCEFCGANLDAGEKCDCLMQKQGSRCEANEVRCNGIEDEQRNKCNFAGSKMKQSEVCEDVKIPCQVETEPDKVNPQKVIENCIDIITRLNEKCKGEDY